MDPFFASHTSSFDGLLDHLKEDLVTLRVGRANPLMVENIMVESYGTKTPLKQLASITVPSVRMLVIQPWDKTVAKDLEKALIEANLGITPVNEGTQIRLVVPQLTEESRRELVKSVHEKMEKCRISIRQVRDRIKDLIHEKEKGKEIAEDARYALIKKLDDLVKDYNDQVKEIGEKKEAEIMEL